MTLETAIAVLNREKHNDFADWQKNPQPQRYYGDVQGDGDPFECGLTAFEAIAIAEKYEREQKASKYLDSHGTLLKIGDRVRDIHWDSGDLIIQGFSFDDRYGTGWNARVTGAFGRDVFLVALGRVALGRLEKCQR